MLAFRAWLQAKEAEILFGLFMVMFLTVVGFYVYSVHLNEKLDAEKLRSQELQFANSQMKTAVDDQNAAFDALKRESDRKAKQAALDVAKAKKASEKHILSANAILGYKGSADQCHDVAELLSEYVGGNP